MNQNFPNFEGFVQHQIIDPQMSGMLAGSFAYPHGWQAGSNVLWNWQNSNSPVTLNAWAVNPQKFEMLAFLPTQSFAWTEPETGMYFRGQNVGGLINLPPLSPADAVRYCLLPTYCGNRENLNVVSVKVEPLTNRPLDPRFQSVFLHQISVRIEYLENNLQVEEEFLAVHAVRQFPPLPGLFGAMQTTGWRLEEVSSFRTEKGRLNKMRETFLQIKSSFQINPNWQQSIQQVAQQLLQNSQQQGDAILRQGWANIQMNQQRMNENAARNQDYINRQQQRIDAIPTTPLTSSDYGSGANHAGYSSSDAFVDAIREEHSIYNPENPANEKVSIHGGDYIWKNERGEVLTSNDANYDPNIGSNGHWVPAPKKRIGD